MSTRTRTRTNARSVDPVAYNHQGTPYHDEHTLYVKSGVASNRQLEDSLRRGIEACAKKLSRDIKCQAKANLIVDRSGRPYGFGYLFVTSPEVYHMLLGRNPDGSSRAMEEVDPTWQPPHQSLKDALAELNTKSSGDWGKDADEEDAIRQLYSPPKIVRELEPLIDLPGYEYDEEQKLHFERMRLETEAALAEAAANGANCDGNGGCVDNESSTHGYFYLTPAYAKDIDEAYSSYILCAKFVPHWIEEAHLKAVFKPYATDSTTTIRRRNHGQNVADTYPWISINKDKGVAFVTFDPDTRDAQFALLMTRKVQLTGRNGDTTVLTFAPSYNNPGNGGR